MPQYLEKEFNVMYVQEQDVELIEKCDLLIVEMQKEDIDKILNWVFRLYCKRKIPILAVTHKFGILEKLLLNRFEIRDYVDGLCDIQEVRFKLNSMIRRINLEKSNDTWHC